MIETYEKSNHVLVIDRTGLKPIVYRIPKGAPIKPPSALRKAANLTKATVGHIRAGRPKASEALIAERFAVCEQCKYLDTAKMQCGKCGCGIKSVKGPFSKLAWADSKCPAGKW